MADREAKNSEAKIRANARYNKKTYDRIEIKLKKGEREIVKAHAAERGESLNQFLNRAVHNQLKLDNENK